MNAAERIRKIGSLRSRIRWRERRELILSLGILASLLTAVGAIRWLWGS